MKILIIFLLTSCVLITTNNAQIYKSIDSKEKSSGTYKKLYGLWRSDQSSDFFKFFTNTKITSGGTSDYWKDHYSTDYYQLSNKGCDYGDRPLGLIKEGSAPPFSSKIIDGEYSYFYRYHEEDGKIVPDEHCFQLILVEDSPGIMKYTIYDDMRPSLAHDLWMTKVESLSEVPAIVLERYKHHGIDLHAYFAQKDK